VGGCALCELARKANDNYFDALLYEGVVDVVIRDALRCANSLCHRHTRQMAGKPGSVLGTAVLHRDVVDTLDRILSYTQRMPSSERPGPC
jgi:hypothetical protein